MECDFVISLISKTICDLFNEIKLVSFIGCLIFGIILKYRTLGVAH